MSQTEQALPKKEKPRVIFIEVADKRDSGFVRDGTEGTKYEERLNCPGKLVVPSYSFRHAYDEVAKEHYNEEIQYIKGQREISVQKQREKGLKPNPKMDKIIIEKGHMSIAREGADIGLFDYMEKSFWNASNPDRSPNASALYKVVDLTKIEEMINERDLKINEAVAMVYTLQVKKGGEWIYQEQRIDSFCELFNVSAERYASKITALAGIAKMYPDEFLDKVAIFEQKSATTVAHALQLSVIKFEGNVAVYVKKDKIIKDLGLGNMKHDQKIEELATYLRSKDGYEANQELEAEVEHAMEVKNNE